METGLRKLTAIELCAGAGGQAIGLHNANFRHVALIENDDFAVQTLNHNSRALKWGWGEIAQTDLKKFAKNHASEFAGTVDLVVGGVPCPPFSKAGLRLGKRDERDLFPAALDVVKAVMPSAVMLENVPGLMEKSFEMYRRQILKRLRRLGYDGDWQLVQASDFGVPQLRPRTVLVAIQEPHFQSFVWPDIIDKPPLTVGETLFEMMSSRGWQGAKKWRYLANDIAPTLVGGSKKHGGPDLGPTRAKRQWQKLHVNAHRVGDVDEIPKRGFKGVVMRNGQIRQGFEKMPLLTVPMAAKLQGFPDEWEFQGSKTHAYRQVGNAFPPPVAKAFGDAIYETIRRINHLKKNEGEAA